MHDSGTHRSILGSLNRPSIFSASPLLAASRTCAHSCLTVSRLRLRLRLLFRFFRFLFWTFVRICQLFWRLLLFLWRCSRTFLRPWRNRFFSLRSMLLRRSCGAIRLRFWPAGSLTSQLGRPSQRGRGSDISSSSGKK